MEEDIRKKPGGPKPKRDKPPNKPPLKDIDGEQLPDKEDGAVRPVLIVGEQKLSDDDKKLLEEAYGHLEAWQQDCQQYHSMAQECRSIYRLKDPYQDVPGTPEEQKALQLQTLKSTVNNCIGDQMDNTPEALMMPEAPYLQDIADEMTDVVRFVFEQNGFESLHRRRVEDFFIAGTAVTEIMWDADMDDGKGNIAVFRVPIENMIWDPAAGGDIQDSRAVIRLTWHPLSWYADHYPDTAPYVMDESQEHNNVGVPESAQSLVNQTEEGKAMMMEYWYRRYDAKKHQYIINVAYFAGHAMLDKYEDVYAHGRYPFQFDAFTPIEGQPVGEGMVYELKDMMRYINRYAHYIDENLRYASKSRMLVRKGSGINSKQLADWKQNLVEGDTIDEQSVRWFDTKPLNGMVTQQMLQFQNDMKMDSGQNQFSRGETTGGVTAASAISSLQEAGGKITRMRTQTLSAGFKKIVEQILWLIAEFYDEDRTQMVTGTDGQMYQANLDPEYLFGPEFAPRARGKQAGHLPPPPYKVQINIQRRNPMRVDAQNNLMIQAYTMAAQAGQNFPLSALFELLTIDGKDRILPKLQEMDQTMAMMQQLQQQNQQLTEQNANMQQSLNSYANMLKSNVKGLQGDMSVDNHGKGGVLG